MQHIAHVQNLQQFSPAYPVQPVYRPNVHNHGQPIYFKQNDVPTEKSASSTIIAETDNKIAETTKTIESKTEQAVKIEKTEQPEKSEKIEPTKLPTPMNEILGVNATAKA